MDAVPPGLRYRVKDVLALLPSQGGSLDGVARERLVRVIADGEPWLGADPALADVGYWMLDARHAVELRRQGCIWLTMFPSVETVRRLAAHLEAAMRAGRLRREEPEFAAELLLGMLTGQDRIKRLFCVLQRADTDTRHTERVVDCFLKAFSPNEDD